MPSGGARRGRRDNGLEAADFVAIGDVDPRVGEHLLDVLALDGIAAYLQPAADLNPVTRSSTVPARPTDRLFADRAHLRTAREYLSKLRADEEREHGSATDPAGGEPAAGPTARDEPITGGQASTGEAPGDATRDVRGARPTRRPGDEEPPAPPLDVDDAWARIVAGFDADVAADATPWPAAEDVTERRRRTGEPSSAEPRTDEPRTDEPRTGEPRTGEQPARERRPAPDRPARADEPSLLDGLDTFGADLPDDEEGYTPPPPPPLPRLSRATVVSLLAIAAGLAVFFSPGLLPVDGNVALLLGFGAVLAGFVGLIWRLRPGGDDEDTDPDDGAVV